MRALAWNLFHGRDFPPDPALLTWRSRLLRITERNATHVQLNRDLFAEFAGLLAEAAWDVALLQECPPRWAAALARACEAAPHLTLTSRNSFAALRSALAHINPDLIASNEGGANLTLVRRASGAIAERRELVLRPGPSPERRTMAFTRVALANGPTVGVANLHASAGAARRILAEDEVRGAAAKAAAWAGADPLLFGGDLNLRPSDTTIFAELDRNFGISGATAPNALDHLLARGLARAAPAARWPAERREVEFDGGALRLSDHAPVEAEFRDPTP